MAFSRFLQLTNFILFFTCMGVFDTNAEGDASGTTPFAQFKSIEFSNNAAIVTFEISTFGRLGSARLDYGTDSQFNHTAGPVSLGRFEEPQPVAFGCVTAE